MVITNLVSKYCVCNLVLMVALYIDNASKLELSIL